MRIEPGRDEQQLRLELKLVADIGLVGVPSVGKSTLLGLIAGVRKIQEGEVVVFDKDVAKRLHDFIYSAGNLRDPKDAYRAFRGRLPSVDPLLVKSARSMGLQVVEG